jgi:hypothetical protein
MRNFGNCNLGPFSWGITGLPEGVDAMCSLPASIEWQGEASATVVVTWADPSVLAGDYEGTVTIHAAGGMLEDSFRIIVTIAELPGVQFVNASALVHSNAGDIVEVPLCVANTGNVVINAPSIGFSCNDLVGASGSMISCDGIVFGTIHPIAVGDTTCYLAHAMVPEDLLGQDYEGVWTLLLNGEDQGQINVTVRVDRTEDVAGIYPNPYSASEHDCGITIALGDAVSGDVAIRIYDMYGVLVRDFTGGSEATRTRDVLWDVKNDDGKDVASGMYIVTIDTGDKVVTRKIMVIR